VTAKIGHVTFKFIITLNCFVVYVIRSNSAKFFT